MPPLVTIAVCQRCFAESLGWAERYHNRLITFSQGTWVADVFPTLHRPIMATEAEVRVSCGKIYPRGSLLTTPTLGEVPCALRS